MLEAAQAFAGAKKRPAKRKTAAPEKPAMAASISAAASMLGCELSDLQEAKKAGAPGFRANGSVNITEVREWLSAHQGEAEGKLTEKGLKIRKLLRQCEKLEDDLAVSRGQHTPNAQIRSDMLRIAAATRAAVEVLIADIPTWEGFTAAELERHAQERGDKICADLHDATAGLYK